MGVGCPYFINIAVGKLEILLRTPPHKYLHFISMSGLTINNLSVRVTQFNMCSDALRVLRVFNIAVIKDKLPGVMLFLSFLFGGIFLSDGSPARFVAYFSNRT